MTILQIYKTIYIFQYLLERYFGRVIVAHIHRTCAHVHTMYTQYTTKSIIMRKRHFLQQNWLTKARRIDCLTFN